MGIHGETFLNDIANSTTFKDIFSNPIYTAIVITLIILLVIFIMFRTEFSDDSNYSFWTLLIRSGFYILLPVMTIVFMHYKNIEGDFERKYDNKTLTNTVGGSIDLKGIKEIGLLDKEIISGAFKNEPTLDTNLNTNLYLN